MSPEQDFRPTFAPTPKDILPLEIGQQIQLGPTGLQPINVPKPGPSTWETFTNVLKRDNYLYTGANYLNDRTFSEGSPKDTVIPEDWQPLTIESTSGIPEDYWDELMKAQNPYDLKIIQKRIKQQIDLNERIGQAGLLTQLASGLVVGAVDPLNYIPIWGQARYLNFAKGIVQNSLRSMPSMAVAASASNTLTALSTETYGTREWITDTLVQTAIGSAIFGAVKTKSDVGQIKRIETGTKNAMEGIAYKAKSDESGKFIGMEATPLDDSVSAAKVKEAQQMYDDGVATFGEAAWLSKLFSWSPNMKGLTSNFEAVRGWTRTIFNNSWVSMKGAAKSVINSDGKLSLNATLKDYYKTAENPIRQQINEAFTKYQEREGAESFTQARFENDLEGYLKGNVTDVPEELAQVAEVVREDLKTAYQSEYQNANAEMLLRDYQARGISAQLRGSKIYQDYLKDLKVQEGRHKSYDEFRTDTAIALRNGDVDIGGNQHVTEMAKMYREHLFDPLKNKAIELGLLPKNVDPATSMSYLTRIWDKNKIFANEQNFIEDIAAWYKDSNEYIEMKLRPLTKAKNPYQKAKARKALQKEIDDGKISPVYLDGKHQLTPFQLEEVNKRSKAFKKVRRAYAKAKKGENKADIQAAKKSLDEARLKLREEVRAGTLEEELLDFRGNLINPDKVWFRPLIPEDRIRPSAEELTRSLLGESNSKTYAAMFGAVSAGGTNPLKSRVIMIPDNVVNKYLVNDIDRIAGLYSSFMGRKLALEESLQRIGQNSKEGKMRFVEDLNNQYQEAKAKLYEKPESKQRTKDLSKLLKEYESAKKFISDSYDLFMGDFVKDPNAGYARTLKAFRDFNAITMRGAVVLYALPEVVASIFRHGFMDWLQHGMIPVLKNLATGKGMRRQDFADAGLGLQTFLGNKWERQFSEENFYEPKTALERGLSGLANKSGNFLLGNYLTDFNETLAASISQARTLRVLKRFQAGEKISAKDAERFNIIGINPKQDTAKMMRMFEKYGEEIDGSFVAHLDRWDDFEAAATFRRALRKEVDMIISKPNMLDVPLALRQPVLASMTQFMNWGFGASANFFIPMIQRPDMQKFHGMMMLMMAGALIDPLRQIIRGEEVDLDPGKLAAGAISNSGIIGAPYDFLSKVNAALDIPGLSDYKADKYRNKDPFDILIGPSAGSVNTVFKLGNMAISGKFNEADLKRVTYGLIPGASNVFVRQPIDALIESFELPQNKRAASGWLED